MDIGVEKAPYILEPIEDPVPTVVPVEDAPTEPVEAPALVPVEVEV